METVLHNPARRAVKIEGALSASVTAASGKAESGHGNGDCLLLDFGRAFFAVADASERHPRASREFLGRIMAALGDGPVPAESEELLALLNSCYAEQPYSRTATFCGVCLENRGGILSALIANGGDSFCAIADGISGEILYKTPPDMCFAGRSLCVGTVARVPLSTGRERIILATDGLIDLARALKLSPMSMCGQYAALYPPDEAADRLSRYLARNAETLCHDDVALLVLNPHALTRFDLPPLWLGGTGRNEERKFRESAPALADRWLPWPSE
ncbi:MAG: SpoIIE family protein phosphatase [Deltaproteobacteria bacterium]|nr:SpoIIE family protein phosphatase [Deltaproteobacteria bacterium]